jgi:hypothetical protein
MAYLQKDCFADFELICLNQLIANFRYQDFKLIKLKQDMNAVIDALKLQKEYELKLQKEYELEQQKQSKKLDNKKNENKKQFVDFLKLKPFQNSEVKPHYLQHIPEDIRDVGGNKKCRDTEVVELFIAKEGLRTLWDRISKNYENDKMELMKKYLTLRHSRFLHDAIGAPLTTSTVQKEVEKLHRRPYSRVKAKDFREVSFEYHDSTFTREERKVIHPILIRAGKDYLMNQLELFFNQKTVHEDNKYIQSMFEEWQSNIGAINRTGDLTECCLCTGVSVDLKSPVFDKFIVHADNEYHISNESRRGDKQAKKTIPVFSVFEAKIFDDESSTVVIEVVRVLAIFEFRKSWSSFNRTSDGLMKRRIHSIDEIVFVVARLEIICPRSECIIPFDIYQYQSIPSKRNERSGLKLACCLGSSLINPVFCISKYGIEMKNDIKNWEYRPTFENKHQIYVITVDRWVPKPSDVHRDYQNYYCSLNDEANFQESTRNNKKHKWNKMSRSNPCFESIESLKCFLHDDR